MEKFFAENEKGLHSAEDCDILPKPVCLSHEKGGPLPWLMPTGMNVYMKEGYIMDLVKVLTEKYMKPELPEMNVGDTVRVLVKVVEGSRERTQAFEGTIIAKKHGGINETITVRRVSYGVGCEKVFPVHSPSIVSVTTIRKGKVRRAKLYYLRDRVGKKAKVKERL